MLFALQDDLERIPSDTGGDIYLDETIDEDEDDDDDEDDDELEGEDDDEDDDDEDDDDDDDEDDDDEDDEEDEDDARGEKEILGKFLLDSEDAAILKQHDKNIKLDALFEAAKAKAHERANENVPVLRNATLALDEAAQALNRMRNESNPRDRK